MFGWLGNFQLIYDPIFGFGYMLQKFVPVLLISFRVDRRHRCDRCHRCCWFLGREIMPWTYLSTALFDFRHFGEKWDETFFIFLTKGALARVVLVVCNWLYLAAVKATNNQKTKNKRYNQFLTTNHDALTESLTDLANTVKEQKQQNNGNDTSAWTNTNDGEQHGDNSSTETNSTQHSGLNMPIEPNSVHNNLSDKNTKTCLLYTSPSPRD